MNMDDANWGCSGDSSGQECFLPALLGSLAETLSGENGSDFSYPCTLVTSRLDYYNALYVGLPLTIVLKL